MKTQSKGRPPFFYMLSGNIIPAYQSPTFDIAQFNEIWFGKRKFRFCYFKFIKLTRKVGKVPNVDYGLKNAVLPSKTSINSNQSKSKGWSEPETLTRLETTISQAGLLTLCAGA